MNDQNIYSFYRIIIHQNPFKPNQRSEGTNPILYIDQITASTLRTIKGMDGLKPDKKNESWFKAWERNQSPHSFLLLINTVLFYEHQHHVPWNETGASVKQV